MAKIMTESLENIVYVFVGFFVVLHLGKQTEFVTVVVMLQNFCECSLCTERLSLSTLSELWQLL